MGRKQFIEDSFDIEDFQKAAIKKVYEKKQMAQNIKLLSAIRVIIVVSLFLLANVLFVLLSERITSYRARPHSYAHTYFYCEYKDSRIADSNMR